VSRRVVQEIAPRVVWAFTEAEFKEALGITDPQAVLTVHVDVVDGMVQVTLART
jgi:hypothetical protein